jgi:uncharacterized protein YrrD
MRKGKSVTGKNVLSLADGSRLDEVHDIVVDATGQRMVALVVDEGGLMSSSRVVPIEEVTSFGKDAVIVRGVESIIDTSQSQALRALVEHDEKILGKKVFTVEGDEQGSIADIYFDETTGGVLGYEVSGGMFGDVSKGTSYLPTEEITTIGTDVIYIQPETATTLDEQVGGIQGAVQGAGEKLKAAGSDATQKFGEVRDEAGRKTAGAGASSSEALVGKRTGSDVESDHGSVIVPRGRRVRPEDVEAAKAAGKLPALTSSVALGTAQEASASAKDSLGSAGDQVGNLWDQFTAKIGEMTDATGRRVDEEQTKRHLSDIADAIGRPVTKVILDRQDNVILNLGDIITHQSIQRAHDSGGLDSLLSSVYKGAVEFSKDEMRAPEQTEAQASVDKATGGATVVDELEGKVESVQREREADRQRKSTESGTQRQDRQRERDSRRREREVQSQQRDEVGVTTE